METALEVRPTVERNQPWEGLREELQADRRARAGAGAGRHDGCIKSWKEARGL